MPRSPRPQTKKTTGKKTAGLSPLNVSPVHSHPLGQPAPARRVTISEHLRARVAHNVSPDDRRILDFSEKGARHVAELLHPSPSCDVQRCHVPRWTRTCLVTAAAASVPVRWRGLPR